MAVDSARTEWAPDWKVGVCVDPACTGVRWPGGEHCMAHLESAALARALDELSQGASLDARGVVVDAGLLMRVLAAVPRVEGHAVLSGCRLERARVGDGASFAEVCFCGKARFDSATFDGNVSFRHATFGDRVSFDGATFGDYVSFRHATFGESVRFDDATFGDHASFSDATFAAYPWFGDTTFGKDASFSNAKFPEGAWFDGATFGDDAGWNDVTFGDHARFVHATFGDDAKFGGASFGENASFADATFGGHPMFGDATFGDGAWFASATFGDRAWFDVAVRGAISLEHATFTSPSRIQLNARDVYARRIHLPTGGIVLVRWAHVDLTEADLPETVILGVAPLTYNWADVSVVGNPKSGRPLRQFFFMNLARRVPDPRPRLWSVQRAGVGKLVLTDVNLSACRFDGAHQLDQLRLEGFSEFARAPSKGLGLGMLAAGGRQAIAEEHEWRAERRRRFATPGAGRRYWLVNRLRTLTGGGWNRRGSRVPRGFRSGFRTLEADEIARLYRDLRKGREDNSDEPGAADFYYGEMEMRRHASPPLSAERLVLTGYWILAGYGQRASRALVAFVSLLLLAAWILWGWGLEHNAALMQRAGSSACPQDNTFGGAVLESLQSATSLFRAAAGCTPVLTASGSSLQLVLRILGPALVALAVLALRGRIKR